jgi:hypothetical protein
MTKEDGSRAYNIPFEILDEYESWGLYNTVKQVMGDWKCDDRDLERLSVIMTFHDICFDSVEVETYTRFPLAGESTGSERPRMLNKRRASALD